MLSRINKKLLLLTYFDISFAIMRIIRWCKKFVNIFNLSNKYIAENLWTYIVFSFVISEPALL